MEKVCITSSYAWIPPFIVTKENQGPECSYNMAHTVWAHNMAHNMAHTVLYGLLKRYARSLAQVYYSEIYKMYD